MVYLFLAMVTAYLLGSIPCSYIAGRLKGVDIRKEGSGNAGATNVLRVIGKGPAATVLILDMLKALIAVTLVASFFAEKGAFVGLKGLQAILGLCVVSGHIWSPFLNFKGGKGVASTMAVSLMLVPYAALAGLFIFLITVLKTGFISLGSILFVVTVPIASALIGSYTGFIFMTVTLCMIVSYRHKSNIKRLVSGTENKIY